MHRRLLVLLFILTGISASASDGGYLFVTFRGEATPMTEQIYFALSQDGRNWEALNKGNPVLVSALGDKGVRDPFLLRSHDGKKFYILATDLSINLHPDWTRATHSASKSLIIWESDDLTHWSDARIVQVASDDAGCAWAPEAVYDEANQDYLVFWASMTKSDNFAKHRIWAARTTDFKTFSEPFIYIEKPGHVIDTDIVLDKDSGKYYRFSKDEQFKSITMEVSDKLMGPWQDVPNFSLAKMTGYEGPECYLLNPASEGNPATWCLILDQYSTGGGYQPFVTHDLAAGQFTKADDFKFPFLFRHGSVLPVSELEYEQLKAAYSGANPSP
jgi:sucrose-6-phosphate hydrolase SacC (GH32 family)